MCGKGSASLRVKITNVPAVANARVWRQYASKRSEISGYYDLSLWRTTVASAYCEGKVAAGSASYLISGCTTCMPKALQSLKFKGWQFGKLSQVVAGEDSSGRSCSICRLPVLLTANKGRLRLLLDVPEFQQALPHWQPFHVATPS